MLAAPSPGVAPDQAGWFWVRQPWPSLVFTAMGLSSDGPSESRVVFQCSWELEHVDLLYFLDCSNCELLWVM